MEIMIEARRPYAVRTLWGDDVSRYRCTSSYAHFDHPPSTFNVVPEQ